MTINTQILNYFSVVLAGAIQVMVWYQQGICASVLQRSLIWDPLEFLALHLHLSRCYLIIRTFLCSLHLTFNRSGIKPVMLIWSFSCSFCSNLLPAFPCFCPSVRTEHCSNCSPPLPTQAGILCCIHLSATEPCFCVWCSWRGTPYNTSFSKKENFLHEVVWYCLFCHFTHIFLLSSVMSLWISTIKTSWIMMWIILKAIVFARPKALLSLWVYKKI